MLPDLQNPTRDAPTRVAPTRSPAREAGGTASSAAPAALAVLLLLGAPGEPGDSGALAAQEAPDDSTATLAGRVVSAMTGGPLADARVLLTGSGRGTFTDSAGTFRIADVPAGLDTVNVELIGFADQSTPLRLKPEATTRVTFLLSETVLKVEDLRVEVAANPLRDPLNEFRRRKALGNGYFITPEEIERQDPENPSDLLRRVPGIDVEPYQAGGNTDIRVVRAALNCRPTFYLNGALWPRHHIDELSREQILALEIYRGSAETPPQFMQGRSRCGAIVIWTRQGGQEDRRR